MVYEYCLKRKLHFTANEESAIGHAVGCALIAEHFDPDVCFADAHGRLFR